MKPKWWKGYADKNKEKLVNKLVAELGENIPVEVVGKGTYLIPRHYIGQYGVVGKQIDEIAKKWGFRKVK